MIDWPPPEPETEDELADDLDEYLDDPPVKSNADMTGWETPDNLIAADWHARRIRRAQQYLTRIEATAATMTARINEWVERRSKSHTEAIAAHTEALHGYHAAMLADDPRQKTIELPTGVRLRSQAGKLSVAITDAVAAIDWCNGHAPSALTPQPPKIDKTILARIGSTKASDDPTSGEHPAVTAEGEIIPGVLIVRGERRFYIDAAPETD